MHRSLALTFVLFAACGGTMTQIEMKGPDQDLATIAGDWQGRYQGQESGRAGDIQFSLELGHHTADGKVLMNGANAPLKISFVKVKSATISGRIEPYTDPGCGCQVETEFLGTVAGNEIDGTFTTKVTANGMEQHGTWKVERSGT